MQFILAFSIPVFFFISSILEFKLQTYTKHLEHLSVCFCTLKEQTEKFPLQKIPLFVRHFSRFVRIANMQEKLNVKTRDENTQLEKTDYKVKVHCTMSHTPKTWQYHQSCHLFTSVCTVYYPNIHMKLVVHPWDTISSLFPFFLFLFVDTNIFSQRKKKKKKTPKQFALLVIHFVKMVKIISDFVYSRCVLTAFPYTDCTCVCVCVTYFNMSFSLLVVKVMISKP